MSTTLEKLQEKQKQLNERVKREIARRRDSEKIRDTRQKILLGAFLKGWCAKDQKVERYVQNALPDFLERARDFELFDFEVPQHILDKQRESKTSENEAP